MHKLLKVILVVLKDELNFNDQLMAALMKRNEIFKKTIEILEK